LENEFFRFNVGEFDCIAIQDGIVDYHNPAQTFFANAPVDEVDRLLCKAGLSRDSWPVYSSPYICLLIIACDQRILIDTGAGTLTPGTGRLSANLKAAGISVEEIDQVVLTHGHPDHIGGIMRDGLPVFPKAMYTMARQEWNFWFNPNVRSMLPVDDMWKTIFLEFVEKNLAPIKDRLSLVDGSSQIVPRVDAVVYPGHTPGHIVVRVESGGEILYAISDLVLHPLNLQNLTWGSVFDQDSDLAEKTKKTAFKQMTAENARILGFHFPFPGIGYIRTDGNGFICEEK
jgi:glyoxylase-like metal-dependent hydrolase (beta-lactamase superfamily II)